MIETPLTEEQKFALCAAAGVPIETKVSPDGKTLLLTTAAPCGIAEPEKGRFIVAYRPHDRG